MKVKELKEFLEFADDDAQVFFVSQPNWPFEYSIRGAALRNECPYDPEEYDPDETYEERAEREKDAEERRAEYQNEWKDRFGVPDDDLPQNEIILIEGSQMRYASKRWWDR